jgi:hypothetical protein
MMRTRASYRVGSVVEVIGSGGQRISLVLVVAMNKKGVVIGHFFAPDTIGQLELLATPTPYATRIFSDLGILRGRWKVVAELPKHPLCRDDKFLFRRLLPTERTFVTTYDKSATAVFEKVVDAASISHLPEESLEGSTSIELEMGELFNSR